MSNYICGDIHANYEKLMGVLDKVGFSDSDTLYSVGDICDRGRDSAEVVRFLRSLGDRFKPVFGNHDIWLYHYLLDTITRDAYDCWMYNGGGKTLNSISVFDEEEKKATTDWLGSFPYVRYYNDLRIIHSPCFEGCLDKCGDIDTITLENAVERGLIHDLAYDGFLFDREMLLAEFAEEMYTNKGKEIPWYDRHGKPYNSIFNKDEKFTVFGHTPLQVGVRVFKGVNGVDIDTGGTFDGCNMTILDLDTMEWTDSSGNKGKVER